MKKFPFLLFFIIVFSCNENPKVESRSNFIDTTHAIHVNMDTIAKIVDEDDLNSNLSYEIIKERPGVELKNDSLKKIIENWVEKHAIYGMHSRVNKDSLIDFILELTKNQLTFTFKKCDSDPRLLVKSKNANCVGYAAFFNSLMNYAIQSADLDLQYECHHYVGKIFYDGTNVNALFSNNPFFKDHDFNIIKNLKDGKDIGVDPSLYEYLGIRRVAIRTSESK